MAPRLSPFRLQSACPARSLVPERFRGYVAPSAPWRQMASRDSPRRDNWLRMASLAEKSWPGCRLPRFAGSPCRQLVGPGGDQAVLGADRGKLGQFTFNLLPDSAERDAEHALPSGEQVHHLIGRRALIDAHAVAHQRDLSQVLGAAIMQVPYRRPDLLQRDPGVEQPLDHLEHQDVTEAVQALRTGAVRGADARLDQARARPVVQLAVGDPGGRAGRLAAVADLGVAVEERALNSSGPTPCYRHGHLL